MNFEDLEKKKRRIWVSFKNTTTPHYLYGTAKILDMRMLYALFPYITIKKQGGFSEFRWKFLL